jgi:hypothetical protein
MKDYCNHCSQWSGSQYPRLQSNGLGGRPARLLFCPDCNRAIDLVDISTAASIVNKSQKTIYDWIKKGAIQTVALADGRRMVIYSTLFRPSSPREASCLLETKSEN